MKKIFLLIIILLSFPAYSQENKTALILIDIQEFYYPGGKVELYKAKEAGLNAQKVLTHFRNNNQLVIHVRHNFEPGGSIHVDVKPIDGEKVISKDQVNCFRDTDLLAYLQKHEIKNIVLVGMQTHMCLEAGTRAAADYGFN